MALFVLSDLHFYTGRLSLQRYLYKRNHSTDTHCTQCMHSVQLAVLLTAGLKPDLSTASDMACCTSLSFQEYQVHGLRNFSKNKSTAKGCHTYLCSSSSQPFCMLTIEVTTKAQVFVGTHLLPVGGSHKNTTQERDGEKKTRCQRT